jgi:hypothetical protein
VKSCENDVKMPLNSERIEQLKPFSFRFRDETKRHFGMHPKIFYTAIIEIRYISNKRCLKEQDYFIEKSV